MGLFDKLKNVFFEEEYVEIEEPVKKEKVTVAKKIETPEAKKAKEEAIKREKEIEIEEVEIQTKETTEIKKEEVKDFKFPMNFDERDFEVEDGSQRASEVRVEETVTHVEEVPVYQEKTVYHETVYKERPIYPEKTVYKEKVETPVESNDYHSVNYQGLYEGSERREKKSTFTPSPIISPIYGILDKNYKKEEIVTKKEVRLSVTTAKKVDLDTVREKAYGDLASEITESMEEDFSSEVEEVTPIDENNLLYDLNDDESPAVKVVTMGDAEEYFNDLGLEYNVDYKVEREKIEEEEKPISRRVERKRVATEVDEDREEEKTSGDSSDDSNLFDLIDSMYEDKE